MYIWVEEKATQNRGDSVTVGQIHPAVQTLNSALFWAKNFLNLAKTMLEIWVVHSDQSRTLKYTAKMGWFLESLFQNPFFNSDAVQNL